MPAFLTRGYGRTRSEPVTVVAPGAKVPSALTGDEAQLLVRSALGPVGIGADRYLAGLGVLQQFPADVFLLDDGFQHWGVARDLDVVLLDALDPFAGGQFPKGWLREPLEALSRADAVVLNRACPGRDYATLSARIREYNRNAQVFLARVVPVVWLAVDGSRTWPVSRPDFRRVFAFCGLGNPAAFWTSLDGLGLEVVDRIDYRDHHVYRRSELREMATRARVLGAQTLVTTEKDAVNLPEDATLIVAPMELFVLKVRLEVENEELLLRLLPCGNPGANEAS
jgi:tetraacyldisaccharide 4'-kinase